VPVNQAFDIAQQICAGLREAHAQGIVHRDLKPANIMLDRSGTVKVMDFGVARLIQNTGPLTGTIVGTPAYMAPEQAELKPIGPCTDIYALGLVLYEMITGIQAFQGDTPVAIALKQIREYPKRPRNIIPNLSHPIEAAILKCLQKDPAKRFQSASELQLALVKAARARAVPAWRVTVEQDLAKAEMFVRQGVRYCIESASTYIKRQDLRVLARIRTEPATAFIASVLLGSAISVALYGSGKTNANNAPAAYQSGAVPSSLSSKAPASGSVSPLDQTLGPNPLGILTSHDVDLRRDSRVVLDNLQSAVAKPLHSEILSAAPGSVISPSQPSRPVKRKQTSTRISQRKGQTDEPVSSRSEAVTDSVQPQTPLLVEASQPAAPEAATNLSLSNVVFPDLAHVPVTSASAPSSGTKSSAVFIEVGSFKNETWAKTAAEKLTELGFHAVVIHKAVLWAQSYRVEVGPYGDPKEIEAARKELALNGYKPHLVN
jgi:serine/threonine protein kinase